MVSGVHERCSLFGREEKMCGSGRERLRERGQGRSREKLRHTDTDRHRHRHRHRHTQKGPHRYTPMAPICSRAPGAVVGMRSRAVSHPKRQRAAATVSAGRGLHQQTKPNKRGGRGRGGGKLAQKKVLFGSLCKLLSNGATSHAPVWSPCP